MSAGVTGAASALVSRPHLALSHTQPRLMGFWQWLQLVKMWDSSDRLLISCTQHAEMMSSLPV